MIDRVGEVVSGAYQAVRMNPSKANKVLLGGAVAGIVGLGTAVVGGVLLATGWGGIFGWLLLGGGAATAVVGGIAVIIALILRRKASYE